MRAAEQTFLFGVTDASLISEGKRMSVNTNKTEKDKALEAAMAQIQKQFGKGAIMKLGDESAQMNIDAISSGSISLDIATGIGGVQKAEL